jgi:hypothetical protein
MTDDTTMENNDESTAEEVNEVENHESFIISLEKHGYSADPKAWERMANDLEWSEEEVKTYAYRYFNALQHVPSEDIPVDDNKGEESWTFEESILLESLLVRHLAIINEQNKERQQDRLAWEELIAARIPGKTAQEVRQRYEQKYRQKGGDSTNGDVITIP